MTSSLSKGLVLTALALAATAVRCLGADAGDGRGCDRKVERISPAAEWRNYSDSAQTAGTPRVSWWTRLGDPLLDSLVQVGLENNHDVLMATRRINIARAQLGAARSAYYPTIGLSAGYTYARQSGLVASRQGQGHTNGYWDLGLTANWEIDIFGKITQQVKAQKANVRVSRAERAGVEISLQAQICQTYIDLRVNQAELDVARSHAQSQLSALNIAKSRFEAGLASMMDVNQAEESYYTTTASIPMLEHSIAADINSLEVLLGDQSPALHDRLSQPGPMLDYVHIINVGTPEHLIRRRPDVAQAENEIDMYAAQLGVARSQWLPSLSVSAAAGTQAHDGRDLFKKQSYYFSVGPVLSWTVFDGFSRKYSNIEATQSLRNAVENYNLTVQTAVQEVNDALSSYFANLRYINSIEKACEASKSYDERALSNYRSGLSSFIYVADAQMSYLQNMNSLITAKGNALNALIVLYKALGGGWDGDVDNDPTCD